MRDPADLPDMAALRAEIDRIDQALSALMGQRARVIDRAAELKAGNGWPARIDLRVDEVVANARENAARDGWDPALAEYIWSELVEWSIRREQCALGRE